MCIFQEGISRFMVVGLDVRTFILESTQHVWMYTFYYMRWWLMGFDRGIDVSAVLLFVLVHIESAPHWEEWLGLAVFVALHVVSILLCWDTDRCECYAVRIVLPWILSGLLSNVALWAPWILNPHDEASTSLPVIFLLLSCTGYVIVFILFYTRLHGYQFSFVHDPFQPFWFYVFGLMRMFLMRWDRLIDMFAVTLFVIYHIDSTPHWEVCMYIYITFRLVFILVCLGTNLCKRYLVGAVLLMAANAFGCYSVFAPLIAELSDGALVIVPVCALVLFRAGYLCGFIFAYIP